MEKLALLEERSLEVQEELETIRESLKGMRVD